MKSSLITARDYLNLCHQATVPILDVRAPVEFRDGHIPESFNAPILTDEERHQVGLTYKQKGNEAATRLGYELVTPHKSERVASWISFLSRQANPVVTCWRGGDRSRIAQEWIEASGQNVLRLQGGYKVLRGALLSQFPQRFEGLSLSGLTGTGKTDFLRELKTPFAVDLEGMANHRGSSFGGYAKNPQPTQATFENDLGLALVRAEFPRRRILLESESRLIGRLVIPDPFFDQMRQLPRIILEAPWETRLENIFREYVELPLKMSGAEEHQAVLLASLQGIKDRLGGLHFQEIRKQIQDAFVSQTKDAHFAWIDALLRHYYDPLYEYSLKKSAGTILFRGTAAEIKGWLTEQDFFAR